MRPRGPPSIVNGWIVESGSSSTSGSIHVVAGSTIVAPASMCSRLMRSRRTAAATASSTRVLTPSTSVASRRRVHCHALALANEVADGVGQVELALVVVRPQAIERRPELLGGEDVDRGVHLVERELGLARVAGLDDRLERAVPVPDDPSVGARLVELEREDGRGRFFRAVRLEEPGEELVVIVARRR